MTKPPQLCTYPTEDDLKAMIVGKYYGSDFVPFKKDIMNFLMKETKYNINPLIAEKVINEWWDSKYGEK